MFPFHEWHMQLMERENQVSEEPYRRFLDKELNVLNIENGSWWVTEVGGWSAGLSCSARGVDGSIRRTYQEGFALDSELVPPERHISEEECSRHNLTRDECDLLNLDTWEDYYKLRGIPLSSPVALLCTFPLTLYRAIQKYGKVPVTVARMLQRQLRVHVLGVEKEMNFLDLFKEVGYLLPEDLNVELTFVVRQDMLPLKCRNQQHTQGNRMCITLTSNLTLDVTSGTYGDGLDPNFDCGSGAPDIVVGMNAGLYAYGSWRSVVSYLNKNRGVVGVFTDYNEHSGMNCASLGGGHARNSLTVNPFRQPRAMPVYCMNLPQFSNGFIYVFNEQELDS